MKVLIVDNYDSFTYNLVQLVEDAGCRDVTSSKTMERSPKRPRSTK